MWSTADGLLRLRPLVKTPGSSFSGQLEEVVVLEAVLDHQAKGHHDPEPERVGEEGVDLGAPDHAGRAITNSET